MDCDAQHVHSALFSAKLIVTEPKSSSNDFLLSSDIIQSSLSLSSLFCPLSSFFFSSVYFLFLPNQQGHTRPLNSEHMFLEPFNTLPSAHQLPLMAEPLTSDKTDLALKIIRHYVFWYAIISTNSSHGPYSGQHELHLLKGTGLHFFSLSSLLFISSFSFCCSLSVCAQMCLSGSCEQIQYSVPLGCSLLKLSLPPLAFVFSSRIFSFTTA